MGAFQTYFLDVIRTKYCQFNGRARRKEYWMFQLFYALIYILLTILSSLVLAVAPDSVIGIVIAVVLVIYLLALILPLLGLLWRRLHDIGKSGVWVLISLVPFVGGIVLFVFTVLDSQPGANRYGPNPKGIEGPAASNVFV